MSMDFDATPAAPEIVFLRARVDAYEARVKALEARESALRDAFNASVDAGALHGERSGEARLARSRVAKAMAAIVCATPLSAPSGEVTK